MTSVMAKLNSILNSECANNLEFSAPNVKRPNDSAIKEHHLFCIYSYSFDGFSISASGNIDFKVTLMVSLLIKSYRPFLNKKNFWNFLMI